MPSLGVAINASGAKSGAAIFSRSSRRIEKGATRASAGVSRLNKRISMTSTVAARAKMAIGGLVAGFGAMYAIRAVTSTIIGFSDSMLAVKAISGATAEEFEVLTDRAKQLGATTRFTATQVSEGMKALAMTGFTVVQTYEAVDDVLALAAASGQDLGLVAEWTSDAMKQFGLTTDDMTRITDVFAKATTSANTTVDRMAEAFSKAGPIASAAGLSIEQTAAAVAALGDAGIAASVAGTSLRQITAAIAGPSNNAKRAMKRLGTSAEEVKAIMEEQGLTGVMRRLGETAMGTRGDLDAVSAAVDIFSKRGAAGALVLSQQIENFEKLDDAIADAEGTTKEMAETMESGIGGAARRAKSALEALMLSLGDAGVEGAMTEVFNISAEVLRIFAGMAVEGEKFSTVAVVLTQALRTLGLILGWIILKKLAGWAIAAGKGLVTLTGAGVKALVTLGAIGAVIGVAIMGYELGSWANDEFRIVRDAGRALAKGLLKIWERIKHGWKTLVESMKSLWSGVTALLTDDTDAAGSQFMANVWGAIDTIVSIGGTSEGIANRKYSEYLHEAAVKRAAAEGETNETLNARLKLLDEEYEAQIKAIDASSAALTLADDEEFRAATDHAPGTLGALQDREGAPLAAKGTSLADRIKADFEAALPSIEAALAAGEKVVDTYFGVPGGEGGGLDAGPGLDKSIMALLAEDTDEAKKKTKELTEEQKEMLSVAEAAGSNMAGAMTDIATGAKTGKEAMDDLVQSTIRLIIQTIILKAVKAGITALGGGGPTSTVAESRGGLNVSAGARRHFAAGGIISQPTMFPMGGGKQGMVGERGAEMVLPLNRVFGRGSQKEERPRPIKIVNVVDPGEIVRKGLERDPQVVLNVVHQNLDEGRDLDKLVARSARRNRRR